MSEKPTFEEETFSGLTLSWVQLPESPNCLMEEKVRIFSRFTLRLDEMRLKAMKLLGTENNQK